LIQNQQSTKFKQQTVSLIAKHTIIL